MSDGKMTFGQLVAELCRTNMDLWNMEDKARVPDDLQVAAAKRGVDKLNQKRNDLIEKIDDHVLSMVKKGS
jgi:hypothetical protein